MTHDTNLERLPCPALIRGHRGLQSEDAPEVPEHCDAQLVEDLIRGLHVPEHGLGGGGAGRHLGVEPQLPVIIVIIIIIIITIIIIT